MDVREYGGTRSASTPYAFRANAVQKAPQSQGCVGWSRGSDSTAYPDFSYSD